MKEVQRPLSRTLLPVYSEEWCRENRLQASAHQTLKIFLRLYIYSVKGNLKATIHPTYMRFLVLILMK